MAGHKFFVQVAYQAKRLKKALSEDDKAAAWHAVGQLEAIGAGVGAIECDDSECAGNDLIEVTLDDGRCAIVERSHLAMVPEALCARCGAAKSQHHKRHRFEAPPSPERGG